MKLNQDLNPWDRQAKESPQAFEAFACYRDLGPARSIYKCAAKLGKSSTLTGHWSAKHRWVDRCADYDNHLDRIKQAEAAKAVQEMGERQAKESRAFSQMLTLPVNALARKLQKDPEGTRLELEALPVSALLEMIRQCASVYPATVKVERLARGEPDVITKTESRSVIGVHVSGGHGVLDVAIEKYSAVIEEIARAKQVTIPTAEADGGEPIPPSGEAGGNGS